MGIPSFDGNDNSIGSNNFIMNSRAMQQRAESQLRLRNSTVGSPYEITRNMENGTVNSTTYVSGNQMAEFNEATSGDNATYINDAYGNFGLNLSTPKKEVADPEKPQVAANNPATATQTKTDATTNNPTPGTVQNKQPENKTEDKTPVQTAENKQEEAPTEVKTKYYDHDNKQKKEEIIIGKDGSKTTVNYDKNGTPMYKTEETKDGTTSTKYDKNGEIKNKIVKNKEGKKVSETAYENGEKVFETTFDKDGKATAKTEFDGEKIAKTTEYNKDGGRTETAYGTNDAGQTTATVRTFNKNGALTSSKTGSGDDTEKAKTATKDAEDATKGGTARELDKDLKDAAFVDKELAVKLIKEGKLDPSKTLKIDGKDVKNDEIISKVADGDLEMYQDKDGNYSINSKVEDGKEKLKVEEKKDFMTQMQEAMESGDFSKLLPLMVMAQLSGGMGGANTSNPNLLAQLTGNGQGQSQKSPEIKNSVWNPQYGFFTPKEEREKIKIANLNKKLEKAEESGDYDKAAKYRMKLEKANVDV